MSTTAHTPTPWIYANNGLCRNKAGEPQFTFGPSMECVGVIYNRTSSGGEGTTEEANAALIVRAVNERDGLLDLLHAISESDVQPGHVAYLSKARIAELAREFLTKAQS